MALDLNSLKYEVRGSAMDVYNILGPGLLESVYEKALLHELRLRGINAKNQVVVPIIYKDEVIVTDLRLDILVEDTLIVELKSVELIKDVFYKQLKTYLRLLNKQEGLLINFGESDFSKGIKTVVNSKYFK